jgi:hypothetical protein
MSFINIKDKVCFIHVPKCGGSYVHKKYPNSNDTLIIDTHPVDPGCKTDLALVEDNYEKLEHIIFVRHPTHSQIAEFMDNSKCLPSINNFFTFTIVRNPWERAVSFYAYACGQHKKLKVKPGDLVRRRVGVLKAWIDACASIASMSFHEYLSNLYQYKNSQSHFLDMSYESVDAYLKQENLENELTGLLERLNITPRSDDADCAKKVVNSSKHKHYTEYYNDDKSIRKIAKIEKDVIDYFGYKYGD